jgi:hypothetical protein
MIQKRERTFRIFPRRILYNPERNTGRKKKDGKKEEYERRREEEKKKKKKKKKQEPGTRMRLN